MDNKKDIGVLWNKISKGGKNFMTGKITVGDVELDIVVFSNDKGDNPKRPDWRIYPSEPRAELNPNGTEKVSTIPAPIDEDLIPF